MCRAFVSSVCDALNYFCEKTKSLFSSFWLVYSLPMNNTPKNNKKEVGQQV
jgi:hypothetical protein